MAYRKNGLRMEDLHSVKLDGLSQYVRKEEIEDHFNKFGPVQDVYIPRDFRSGKNKGFGFVRFEKETEAEDAADSGGCELDGQRVAISLASRPKRETETSWGRGGGKGRGGGGRRGSSRSRSRGRGGGRRDSRGRGRGRDDRRDSRGRR